MKKLNITAATSLLFLICACGNESVRPLAGYNAHDKNPPKDLALAAAAKSGQDSGKALIERFISNSSGDKIYSDLCLISENAVTVVQSTYNTQSSENSVKTHQRFMLLGTPEMKKAISDAITAPKIFDEKAKSDSGSVLIYLFDSDKNPENPDLHVLFSHNSEGTEKKDAALTPSLIASTDQICSLALIKN